MVYGAPLGWGLEWGWGEKKGKVHTHEARAAVTEHDFQAEWKGDQLGIQAGQMETQNRKLKK
jgi:hypothetical protein